MKRAFALLLAVCMLLCACAQESAGETTAATTEATTTAATVETTAETTVETEPVVETTMETVPVIRFRHPLTGEPLEEKFTSRPYLVVINNINAAMPQCSVSNADMMFEILAEGGITRCLALYSDLSGLEHIGSIRSARPYLVDIANSFGAVFIHHGGSKDGYNEIYNTNVVDLDGISSGAFYRDKNRLNAGYALEHTSFADGDDLIAAATKAGYDLVVEEGVDYGFNFGDNGSVEGGETAGEVTVKFGAGGKPTVLTYDEATGLYAAYQHGGDLVDGNTGEVVCFRNVISISAETHTYSNDGDRLSITLTGNGEGYFACDGKIVPIRWSRASRYEPFSFTLTDGTPITLGVGTTYIGVTPLSGEVSYK